MRADLRVMVEQLDISEDDQFLWGWQKKINSLIAGKSLVTIGNVLAELDEMIKRPDINQSKVVSFTDVFKTVLWLITDVPKQAAISAEAAYKAFVAKNDHYHAMLSKWLLAIVAWDSGQFQQGEKHLFEAINMLRKLQKQQFSEKLEKPWSISLEMLEVLYALQLTAEKKDKVAIPVLVELREELRSKIYDAKSAEELEQHLGSRFDSINVDHDYFQRTYLIFFRACIHFALGNWDKATGFSKKAADEFRIKNMRFNQAIAQWLIGLCYLRSKDKTNYETARHELKGSLDIFQEIKVRVDNNDLITACNTYIARIVALSVPAGAPPDKTPPAPPVTDELPEENAAKVEKTQEPQPSQEKAPEPEKEKLQPGAQVIQVIVPVWNQVNNHADPVFAPVANNHHHNDPVFAPVLNGLPPHTHKGMRSISPNGSDISEENEPVIPAISEDYADLPWFPVYHSVVHANIGSGFDWVEPTPEDSSGLSFITIDGRIYQLESVVPGAHKIRIAKSKDYGLVKVDGNSMNAAKPSIENGNYVLFYKSSDTEENVNKIVIASRPMEKGYSYLIKKLTRTQVRHGQPINYELVSLTHETGPDYDNLPLSSEHSILGVVVAIAKPVDL